MILYAALAAGLDYDTAITLPATEVMDIIAAHQIMAQGYDRIFSDPRDIEDDFLREMSAR